MLVLALVLRSLDINFDVNQAIKQLTDVLGKYGPLVWDAIIRQVYLNGVYAIVWMLIFIAAGITVYRLCMKGWRYGHAMPIAHASDDREWIMGLSLAGLAIGEGFCGGYAIWNLQNALQDFINPVWAAVQLLKSTSGN